MSNRLICGEKGKSMNNQNKPNGIDWELQQEEYESQRESDIVPCYLCGCQMYWESDEPVENLCLECKKILCGDETISDEINF